MAGLDSSTSMHSKRLTARDSVLQRPTLQPRTIPIPSPASPTLSQEVRRSPAAALSAFPPRSDRRSTSLLPVTPTPKYCYGPSAHRPNCRLISVSYTHLRAHETVLD